MENTSMTRPALYWYDHRCQVCFLVHVTWPCCEGCPCLSDVVIGWVDITASSTTHYYMTPWRSMI